MNVRQLQAFRSVIDLGSVTRAAEALRISQPAVSKLIGILARDCGFELFLRSGNRLMPTAEALSLYREVERIFMGVEHIERHAEAIRDLRSGQIAIAAFPAIATRPLPRLITKFLDAHPDTRFSLVARSGRLLVELVAANRVDLGIGLLMTEHPGIDYRTCRSRRRRVRDEPQSPLARRKIIRATDLTDEPFISLGAEDRSRFRVDKAFEGTA